MAVRHVVGKKFNRRTYMLAQWEREPNRFKTRQYIILTWTRSLQKALKFTKVDEAHDLIKQFKGLEGCYTIKQFVD